MYRLRVRIEAPVHDGVTGEIIAEMRPSGSLDGCVRYGSDGTDLRDPAWSWRVELGRGWSTIRSAMTRRDWTSTRSAGAGSPCASVAAPVVRSGARSMVAAGW